MRYETVRALAESKGFFLSRGGYRIGGYYLIARDPNGHPRQWGRTLADIVAWLNHNA
jgi:hypothetical protein